MDPNETRARGMRIQPDLRSLSNIHSPAFQAAPTRFCAGWMRKIVIEVKPAIQSRGEFCTVKHHRSNERRGLVTCISQQLSQSRMGTRQGDSEIRNAVVTRQQ